MLQELNSVSTEELLQARTSLQMALSEVYERFTGIEGHWSTRESAEEGDKTGQGPGAQVL